MHPKDADGMANNVAPDQTAPQEQSDLGLHCLLRSTLPICLFDVIYIGLMIQTFGFHHQNSTIYNIFVDSLNISSNIAPEYCDGLTILLIFRNCLPYFPYHISLLIRWSFAISGMTSISKLVLRSSALKLVFPF